MNIIIVQGAQLSPAERFPYKEEVTGSNPVAPTRVFQKSLHIYTQKTPNRHQIIYYEVMKYKKDLGGFLVFLGLTWQVFSVLDSSYTPTQVILTVIFAYLGVRLTYFVYFKNEQLLVLLISQLSLIEIKNTFTIIKKALHQPHIFEIIENVITKL